MPSSFKCRIDIDVSNPDYSDASIPLGQVARKIAESSRRNIRTQTSIKGHAFKGLSVKTIKDKRREGSDYPTRALYRKGIMYRAIHVYQRSKNAFEVGIIPRGKPKRDLVGYIHQEIYPIIRAFLGFDAKSRQWSKERFRRWMKERKEKAKRTKSTYSY